METFLKIQDIKFWSRVGVLDSERELGQLFSLDIFLWANFDECSEKDNLATSIDYSILIDLIKNLARNFSCFTIEKFSDEILHTVNQKFKPTRIKIILTKCNPPINGFNGEVSIVKDLKNF
tara:strand:+ start:191 stop:553 length:363 start_codon:yes stop_codon:yes gene_type:complete